MYIVLEGLDGVGKTTLAELLGDWIKARIPRPVYLTREPGSIFNKLRVRDLILHGDLDRTTVEFLLQADRTEHTGWVKSKLDEGGIVISDRSFISGFAYGVANGFSLETLSVLTSMSVKVMPDYVFFITNRDAQARIKERSFQTREEKGEGHPQRVSAGFEQALTSVQPLHQIKCISLDTTGDSPEQSLVRIVNNLKLS